MKKESPPYLKLELDQESPLQLVLPLLFQKLKEQNQRIRQFSIDLANMPLLYTLRKKDSIPYLLTVKVSCAFV